MRQRLTDNQKMYAVAHVLLNAFYPLSTREVGRRCGFADGVPVKKVLREFAAEGWVLRQHGSMFGKKHVDWWLLTPEGRERLKRNGFTGPAS
jgi:hypothetical protein